MENDVVDIREDGKLLINGFIEDREVYYETLKDVKSDIVFPYEVQKDEVFLINDYRKVIGDSRTYGGINKEDIKGKVIGKIQIRDF